MTARRCCLLALWVSTVHAWSGRPSPRDGAVLAAEPWMSRQRARSFLQLAEPLDASTSGAATGAEDIEKTDGIPNYMIRTIGTVSRLAEGPDSEAMLHSDGVVYERDRLVTIVTSDVIDMVQQQGAETVDHIGENILVEGMLFDDFTAEATFDLAAPDSADVVTLEIVEPRPSSRVELGQLGDDEAKKKSIAGILSLAPGFSGWTARVVLPGTVRAGFKIAKRPA